MLVIVPWLTSTVYHSTHSKLIEGNSYEAWQTSKEQTKMPRFTIIYWKVHNCAQSFVLHSCTTHESCFTTKFIYWFVLQSEVKSY